MSISGSLARCASAVFVCVALVFAGTSAPAADALDGAMQPYPSTYQPAPAEAVAFIHATILDGAGRQYDDATLLVVDGRVAALGSSIEIPQGMKVIDAEGRWITPGIIDVHSHLGVYASPLVPALSDGNEFTDPNTAEVWAEHSVWPQDPGFKRARAGGVTTLQILPGSTNLFGGRSVVLRNARSVTVQGMKFPGAKQGLKMACGENPKTVYGGMRRAPSTRMGSMAGFRAAWAKAVEYKKKLDDYDKDKNKKASASPPPRDLEMETLVGALRGELHVHIHCYRADEIAQMFDLADEFGFKIATIEHAVEAYKLGDLFRRKDACISTWSDMWGYKLEMYDGIPENAALVAAHGNCVIIHSDSENRIQQLNQDVAKAMYAGRRAGIEISKAQAWTWVSSNPARALGVGDQTGSLEPGKRADVVLWSGDPFSVYALADLVLLDGVVVHDRREPGFDDRTDFELGQKVVGVTQ